MNPTKRIFVNTLAQYIRTVLNVFISLYATRLVLSALGQSDFGLYALVTSVVTMLTFVTDALMITTQRHISHSCGKSDGQDIRGFFSNSVALHIMLGVLVCGVMILLKPWLLNSMMKIPVGRESAAALLYLLATLMLLTTFLTAPLRAMLVARENIVYVSIIDVIDALIKLGGALWLGYSAFDRLVMYGLVMCVVFIFRLIAFLVYCLIRFDECRCRIRVRKSYMLQLLGFAGWTVYGTACILVRAQGLAVVINRAFSTLVNAAYGIAQQVMGATTFVAQSIMNAMNPQIMSAEGAGDRARMKHLSLAACKYELLLMSVVTIPLVAEMPAILQLWLGEVPVHCVLICRMVLIASCLDQLTVGLAAAIQAVGRIGWFTVTVNTVRVLTVPFAVLVVAKGGDVRMVMWVYLAFEVLCAILRLPFAIRLVGLTLSDYLRRVILPVLLPIASAVAACLLMTLCDFNYRFLVTATLSVAVELLLIWFAAMSRDERTIIIESVIKRNSRR